MPGSSTTPGRSDLAMVRPKRVAFRARNSVGTRGLAFAAQWLAYALPYRRFVGLLTDANARLGADVDRSGRTEARTGLRMMPTSPRSPYHSVRRVFPGTAGRLAFQTGPSQHIGQLKPPGMRWSVSGLRPSFVRLVTSAMAPL